MLFTVQCSLDLLLKIVASLRFAFEKIDYDSSTSNLCFRDIEKPQDRYLVEKERKQINMIGETREQAFGIHYADGTYCNIKLTRPP